MQNKVGVDHTNLRAHKAIHRARLCLRDLGGTAAAINGGSAIETGAWAGNNLCRWQDLHAADSTELVGDAFADGDLLLLHDKSQPLRELTAAAKASMGPKDDGNKIWSGTSSPRRGALGGGSGVDTDGCDMASIGSWYAGGASAADDGAGGAGSGSSSPLVLGSKSVASGASSTPISTSYKPKERALRIRTRRDRLQDGKNVAAAAAAAAATAAATAAAATIAAAAVAAAASAGTAASADTVGSPAGAADGSGSGEEGARSPGSVSDVTVVGGAADGEGALSSGEDTVGPTGANSSSDHNLDVFEGGDHSSGNVLKVEGGMPVEVEGRGSGAGVWVSEAGTGTDDVCCDDLWLDEEEEACAGKSQGGARDGSGRGDSGVCRSGAVVMHSETEVAERGGLEQFEDLV